MKHYLIIATILLLMPFAHAEVINSGTFSAELKPIINSVFPGEEASYQLQIRSSLEDSVRFKLYTLDPQWIISTDPLVGESMRGNKTFVVYVNHVSGTGYGSKLFELKLSNIITDEIVQFSVPISIKNPDSAPGVYVASINADIDMERDVDPREEVITALELVNRNGRNLDPLTVTVGAVDDEGNELFPAQTFQTSIGPWNQKNKEIRWNLNDLQSAGSYKLYIKVFFEDKIIYEKDKTFMVIGYNEIIQDEKNSMRLLDSKNIYTLTNDGNQNISYNVSRQINWFSRLFLGSDADFRVTTNEQGRFAYVTLNLEPQESQTVSYTIHWNYLALIILVIVMSLFGYYKLRNPLISIKEILIEHTKKDNIEEAKIRIFVRNRSNKVLNNIRIIDKVPPIADVLKSERLGTLQPTKINATKTKGTLIKWELNSLEPYEERIITYKIKSKLEIVGGLSLPPTKIIFEEKEGKERQAFSNNAKL